jgi:hypothetical protein
MSANERELVEQLHREAIDQHRKQKERERALVEQVHREAWEHYGQKPPSPAESPRGVHYTELPEAKPGEVFADEWNTYRREVGRLLAEGHEGSYLLIKGEAILGIYESWDAARQAGLKRFLREPFFVHPIRAEEPYLRIRGVNFPWPS